MAAQLAEMLSEESSLIQSSGGVFEVEDRGVLVFSKKKEHRFPADGEIVAIVEAVEKGTSLSDAQAQAGANIPQPPSFLSWLAAMIKPGDPR